MLRRARSAVGFSVEDMAGRLNLDPKIVRYLENDDYDKLAAPTFVRGYLRGYARLLGLPPEPVLEAFNRRGFEPPRLRADIASKSQARSSDVLMRFGTFLVIAGLAVLVVLWWQNERVLGSSRPTTEPEPSVVGSPATDADLLTSEAPSAAGQADATESSTTPLETESEPAAARGESQVADNPIRLAPALDLTLPATAPTQAAVETPPADEASAPPPGAVPQPNLLRMSFKHDSWVEVYDGDGERLYYDFAKKGRTLELRGTTPYRVLLGYARDARIEYNGQVFDHLPYVSEEVARFTVGEP